MAEDEVLAERIRGCLPDGVAVTEQRMFGGLAFLVAGHLAVAASGEGGLMVRCDHAATEDLLARPCAGPMVMRGRTLDGWLRVDVADLGDDAALQDWVDVGIGYVRSLPPKPGR